MKTILFVVLLFGSFYSFSAYNSQTEYTDTSKIELVTKVDNEFILDYLFIDSGTYVQLYEVKKDYFLKIISENDVSTVYPLRFQAKKLYRDVHGNVYVLTDDKAYEIECSTFVMINKQYTLQEFKDQIECLITQTPDYSIKFNLKQLPPEYDLMVYLSNGESRKMIDIDNQATSNIIPFYKASERQKYDYFLSTTKDKSLHEANMDYYSRNHKQKQIHLMKITTVAEDSLVYIFDLWNSKLFTYYLNSFTATEQKLDLKENHEYEVYHDEFSGGYYLIDTEKGVLTVHSVNKETGAFQKPIIVHGMQYEKDIKINNGYVYFLKLNDAGYNKLYRFQL